MIGPICARIPGISSIRSSVGISTAAKTASYQNLEDEFPTHLIREFFWALQGIRSDHQGTFRPDQGSLPYTAG